MWFWVQEAELSFVADSLQTITFREADGSLRFVDIGRTNGMELINYLSAGSRSISVKLDLDGDDSALRILDWKPYHPNVFPP